MTRGREWLVPLTGVGFVLLGIVSFIVGGEPKSADEPVREIVDYYVDNKDSIQVAAFIGVAATLLLVFFGAYLRGVLRAAAPEGEILSLVSFLGWSSSRWDSPSIPPSRLPSAKRPTTSIPSRSNLSKHCGTTTSCRWC